MSVGCFWTVMAVLIDRASAYQTLCLIGTGGWHDVTDFHWLVDDSANVPRPDYVRTHAHDGWAPIGEVRRHKIWGYTLTVAQGDKLHLRMKKKGRSLEIEYQVEVDVMTVEGNVFISKARVDADSSDVPILYIVMARVQHQDVWQDFIVGDGYHQNIGVVKSLDKVDTNDETKTEKLILECWFASHKLHKGWYMNIFADHMSKDIDSLRLAEVRRTKPKRGRKPTTSTGDFNAAFAGWSFPRRSQGSDIRVIIGDEEKIVRLVDDSTAFRGFHKIEFPTINGTNPIVYLLVFRDLDQIDGCWREIHKHHSDEPGQHPYWHFGNERWKEASLRNLWRRQNLGLEVVNRASSRPWRVAVTLGVILVVGAVIAFLLIDSCNRRNAEADAHNLAQDINPSQSDTTTATGGSRREENTIWPAETVEWHAKSTSTPGSSLLNHPAASSRSRIPTGSSAIQAKSTRSSDLMFQKPTRSTDSGSAIMALSPSGRSVSNRRAVPYYYQSYRGPPKPQSTSNVQLTNIPDAYASAKSGRSPEDNSYANVSPSRRSMNGGPSSMRTSANRIPSNSSRSPSWPESSSTPLDSDPSRATSPRRSSPWKNAMASQRKRRSSVGEQLSNFGSISPLSGSEARNGNANNPAPDSSRSLFTRSTLGSRGNPPSSANIAERGQL